jgi:hypothetical protein
VEGEDFDAEVFERLADRLGRWAADQRVAAAAEDRRRAHWLRHQAAESATLAGVLADLAERSAVATIETAGGTHTGRVEAVTSGLCALRRADGGVTLIALPAVTAVRSSAGLPTGDRTSDLRLDMAGALAALSADRCDVTVELAGGARVAGRLDTVGVELAHVRVGRGLAATTVLVVLDAVTACLI